MLSSTKIVCVIVGIYALVAVLPGLLTDSVVAITPDAVVTFTPETVRTTVIACLAFIGGIVVGGIAFPIPLVEAAPASSREFRIGLTALLAVTAGIAVYVAVVGPTPPFIAALSLTDSRAISMLREEAVKLNPDQFFVRIFVWGRDIFASVTFILSVHAIRSRPDARMRMLAIGGIVASLFLGLWSGQKAVAMNYLVATFIFVSTDVRAMARVALRGAPILVGLVALLFWITLPEFLSQPDAARGLFVAIAGRVFLAPLTTSTAYIDAVDTLHIVGPADALPYFTFLWTPGMLSLENEIDLQYFFQGVESGHANALAFAYAYVIGGFIACFIGGIVVMAGLRLAMKIVAATGSRMVLTTYSAWLCYTLLDLINGNFVVYLFRDIMVAILAWIAFTFWPRRRAVPATAQKTAAL